jgi:hypothetical protein
LGKGRCNVMPRFIFVTPEKLMFKPYGDSPLPDSIDMEMIASGQELTVEDALKDILELDEPAENQKLDETYSLDLKNDSRKFFQLIDYKNKISIAS